MKTNTLLHALLSSTLVLAACGAPLPSQTGHTANGPLSLRLPNDKTTKGNSPPFIQSLTSQPSQVQSGSTVTLKAQGFDVESQNLTYRWTASRGTLLKSSGTEVQWKAEENGQPIDSGFAIVSVVVDDGQHRVKGDVNIVLEQKQGQAAVDASSVTLVCTPTPPKEVASLVLDEKLSPVFYEVPTIAAGRITLDGEVGDWDGVLPALQDAAQDHGGSGDDIRALYLAQDNDFLYYRIDTYNPPQSQPTGRHVTLGETGRFDSDSYPQAEEAIATAIEGKIPRSALTAHGKALQFYLSVALPGTGGTGDRTRPLGLINIAEVVRLRSNNNASTITNLAADYVNPIGMSFKNIPAGPFIMGDDGTTNPNNEIFITGFQIQTTEVTQKQWENVMGKGNWPERYKTLQDQIPIEDLPGPIEYFGLGDNHPMYRVSWCDIVGVEGDSVSCAGYNKSFLKTLNAQGHGKYRLPTEAEWEYAARAGTSTAYACPPNGKIDGNSIECLNEMGWHVGNTGVKDTPDYGAKPVAQKKPNPWGLYDMHGNVWEWVNDVFHEKEGNQNAPTDMATENTRVRRGGSWHSETPKNTYSTYRNGKGIPTSGYDSTGFRLVREDS
jgi:formylglycine-generating enzyme required for sulfatase activity